jgi:hypothetical protein
VLVAFPVPPREAQAARASLGIVKPCEPCPFATPQRGELAVGAPLGQLTAGAWLRRDGKSLKGVLRVLDGKRRAVAVAATIAGAPAASGCGRGCWRFELPATVRTIDVRVESNGEALTARLPARWTFSGDRAARRLLSRATRAMRRLRTLTMIERVTSAQGQGREARTELSLQAPDRIRLVGKASETIIIGRDQWLRTRALPGWQRLTPADAPFRVRDGFRWTVFASTARLLRINRETAEVAFFDYGYPIWYRLTIDRSTGLARESQLVTPENRIRDSYSDFNEPVEIRAPAA